MPNTTTPLPRETQPQFAERFHSEMEAAIPGTDSRNDAMFDAWSAGKGQDDLDRKAYEAFGDDTFHRVAHVPVFAEHSTKDREGNLVVYDRDALQVIADRCNARILDTGDFSPITAGHTPDKDSVAQGAKQPEILGYAGPFRLGKIGNTDPRFAIFADEFHMRDKADTIRNLPRRSPEVWLEDRMEERFLDPIAALGSETPRLDMGMTRYRRTSDGRDVAKYVAAEPSAGSVFIQSDDDWRKEKKYASLEQTEFSHMDASPELVEQIVKVLLETAPMQWVIEQMDNGPMPAEVPGDPMAPEVPAAPPGMEPPGMEPPAAPIDEGIPPMADEVPPVIDEEEEETMSYSCDDEDNDKMQQYMSGDCDDDDMKEYARVKRGRRKKKVGYDATGTIEGDASSASTTLPPGTVVGPENAQYAKRARQTEEVAKLRRENADMNGRLKTIEHARDEADRYGRLATAKNEGFAFDLDTEEKRCSKMSPTQFDAHMVTIRDNYTKIPLASDVPAISTQRTPVLANEFDRTSSNGKPTRDQAEAATKYCLSEREKGNQVEFAEAIAHVLKDTTA